MSRQRPRAQSGNESVTSSSPVGDQVKREGGVDCAKPASGLPAAAFLARFPIKQCTCQAGEGSGRRRRGLWGRLHDTSIAVFHPIAPPTAQPCAISAHFACRVGRGAPVTACSTCSFARPEGRKTADFPRSGPGFRPGQQIAGKGPAGRGQVDVKRAFGWDEE